VCGAATKSDLKLGPGFELGEVLASSAQGRSYYTAANILSPSLARLGPDGRRSRCSTKGAEIVGSRNRHTFFRADKLCRIQTALHSARQRCEHLANQPGPCPISACCAG
jgi:hypothetical protein